MEEFIPKTGFLSDDILNFTPGQAVEMCRKGAIVGKSEKLSGSCMCQQRPGN
jgi:hypothetical protein